MKKWLALLLAMILVLSLCATAFAAKPTVSLASKYKDMTVKRGKTVSWVYSLNAGSYSVKKGEALKARFYIDIHKGGKTGAIRAYDRYEFSGKVKLTAKFTVPSSFNKGKYTNVYYTLYKSGSKWIVNSKKTSKLTVK